MTNNFLESIKDIFRSQTDEVAVMELENVGIIVYYK
jgi:hypothetical protein